METKKSTFRRYYEGELSGGGSFDYALVKCWYAADNTNKRNLLKGFPHFFNHSDLEYFCGTQEPVK